MSREIDNQINIKDMPVTMSIYCEVKNSDVFGGIGSVGYVSTHIGTKLEHLGNEKQKEIIKKDAEMLHKRCGVSREDVRIITKDEYDDGVGEKKGEQ